VAGMRPSSLGLSVDTPDRGQLILAGAFVIAVTLIATLRYSDGAGTGFDRTGQFTPGTPGRRDERPASVD